MENKDEKAKFCLHDWCVAAKENGVFFFFFFDLLIVFEFYGSRFFYCFIFYSFRLLWSIFFLIFSMEV